MRGLYSLAASASNRPTERSLCAVAVLGGCGCRRSGDARLGRGEAA